jgi:glycosyltransferase involved in cell wall biosynthesis
VRVGVDGRSLVGGGARGVAHYTAALLEALAAEFPDDEYRVLLPRGRAMVPRGTVPVRHPLPSRVLFAPGAFGLRLDRLVGPVDVTWAPAPAPLAPGGTPFVLTVHDRSWEVRPGDFTRYERAWHAAARPRWLARRATAVLCDAEAVRGELLAEWGLDAARVHAVPLAARPLAPPAGTSSRAGAAPSPSGARSPASGATSAAAAPYFLFVGALEPRKAPDLLAEAFLLARKRGLDAELVFAGDGRLDPRGPGIRRLGQVDDLGALYAGALAIVLPSWLEGFGLPPVEGLTAGAPAIVSDLPVFHEVLGDGALFVPPGDVEALAEALLALAGDPALRARLLEAGRAKTAPLSWAATARRTRAVLAEAAA